MKSLLDSDSFAAIMSPSCPHRGLLRQRNHILVKSMQVKEIMTVRSVAAEVVKELSEPTAAASANGRSI